MSMSTSLALHNLNNLKFEAASTSSPGSILALLQQHIGSWREGPDSSLYCSILRCGMRNKERCISLMEVSWIWRLLSHGVPKGSSCLARDRIQVMTTDSEQLASMHPTTTHHYILNQCTSFSFACATLLMHVTNHVVSSSTQYNSRRR
eukprot:scaffold10550_cov119-Skeletonema_menzelii.AAC.2